MLRVLVLAAPFGSGHRRAAEALGRGLAAEGARVEVVDHFERFVPAAFVRTALTVFWGMLRWAPGLWGLAYRLSATLPVRSPAMSGMDHLGAGGLLAHLQATRPDAVVHVHPTSAGAMAWLRARGRTALPHGLVFTDFAAHPQWIYPGVDRYFVPADRVADDLAARGVPRERIVASGIPIDPAFALPPDRDILRARLGLDPGRPALLVIGGMRGTLGGIAEACDVLAGIEVGFTAVVACGEEAGLLAGLQRRFAGDDRFRILGRVDDMPAVMGAVDLVVTKAGALTCAEALALERPLVLYRSLPGQERVNEAFLESEGAGVRAGDRATLARHLGDLLRSPEGRARLAAGARRLRRPDAARTVAKEMLGLAGTR